jgi:formate dehydrogenase major subunit
MSLNRRKLLKISAGAGAGLAIGTLGMDGPLGATPRTDKSKKKSKSAKVAGTQEFTTACNFCSCGCGMIAQVANGKVVNLEGDPDHVINEGALCSKGAAMSEIPNSKQRVTAPRYRAPGSDKWQEISWDEALTRVAKQMKKTREEHWLPTETLGGKEFIANRTDAIAFMGGAQNTNEECYLVTKLARLAGTVAVEHQARL